MNMEKKYTILISGATATGKSSFAEEVARQVSGEIINADIGSFYEKLTVGVAKPDWQASDIQHHLFDVVKEPELYSVVKFREHISQLIKEVWHRGNVPVIVGGSAFYIQAFFYKQHEIAGVQYIAERLDQSVASSEMLWQKLHIIDADRAKKIQPQDRYRIVRALAIWQATGKKPSLFAQKFAPLSPYYLIVCDRDRKDLYHRIDQRTYQMLEEGWVQEVESLMDSGWESFLVSKKIIGYDDIIQALRNHQDPKTVIPIIQQKTRNYAKRQVTFLKKLQKDLLEQAKHHHIAGEVEQIDLTLYDVGLYIKQLVLKISKAFG